MRESNGQKMIAKNPVLLFSLLLCVGLSANATTYYVSSVSGNDSYSATQAQSSKTPWKTMAKVNSFFGSLNPGDSVLLEAGSVFTTSLYILKSGTAAKPIVISVYGSGNMPVISGFTSMSSWTSAGGGVWQSPCSSCGGVVNMVMIGDSSQPMGRFPNAWSNADAGYDQIQSFNSNLSITNSHIGASGHNWTGSKVVIRKNRWVIESDSILSQSGNTVTYNTGSDFAPAVKYGYFFQDNINTLDQPGEWFYNQKSKLMDVYSASNPSAMGMQVARIDTLVSFRAAEYVVLNGIAFQGANKTAISFLNSSFNTLSNCTIRWSGIDAIDITNSNGLVINNVLIDYTNNDAINAAGNYNTIQHCTIRRTGAIPGACMPLNSAIGIFLNGNNNKVQYNTVDTTGYSGISFQGVSNTIANNLINYFCFVKDDGGGIYTWSGNLDSTVNKSTGWITGNIVLNGVTAPGGTDSSVAGIAIGIYLDENTTECIVTGNTVAHCTSGIFFQDARNCAIQNNTLFDNKGQIVMRHALSSGTFGGNDVSGNYGVSRLDTEYIVEASSIGPTSALGSFGYMHDNHYAQLATGSYFYLMAMSNFNGTGTFGSWQTTYAKDVALSNLLPVSFPPYTVNSLIGSDLYTKGNISTPFSSAPAGVRVITSAGVGAIESGYYYVLNYTMTASDNAHIMLNFLEENAVPYIKLSSVISTPTVPPSSNNTVVWQATGTYPSALLVFQLGSNVPTLSLSNITFYHANVTINNPANDYIFQYNAGTSTMTLPLSGTYEDAAGNTYSTSVKIPAYGSVVLIKKS